MRAALIPMKELSQAKMRLADALDREARAELALAMLTDVIAACNESGSFGLVGVVTSDTDVFWHVRELGAKPLPEPATLRRRDGMSALNEGLTFAQRYLARRLGATELVVLPADIPLVRAEDLRAVAEALGEPPAPRAVIVRARDNGTNALALRPPEAIAMAYGRDSADAHADAARAAGLELVELTLERMAFDVDAPADLDALPSLAVGAATAGWLDVRAHARAAGAR